MSFSGKSSQAQPEPIKNDGFWPDLQVGDLNDKYRIPSEYDPAVVKTGLLMAILAVNRRLAYSKTAFLLGSYASLAAYTTANSQQINGVEHLVMHYQHAAYCTAKAHLLQQFNSMNRRPNAENAAKEAPEMEDHWLDQAEMSIAEITRAVLPDDTPVSNHGVLAVLI